MIQLHLITRSLQRHYQQLPPIEVLNTKVKLDTTQLNTTNQLMTI